MNDAVDRLLLEREAMDTGLPGGLVASAFAHSLLVGVPLLVSLLTPHRPPIKIVEGFAVQLPRGGGAAEPPGPAPQTSAPPETAPPQPEPPPKVLKPPREEKRRGLPEPDAKKGKTPKPAAGGAPAATGKGAQSLGLSIGPPGPGVPDGSDAGGDWYLASVQQRIFMIWAQQIKTGFNQPIGISFTILADGSVEDVRPTQPSGVALLDLAAQRAIYSAQPFGPLPKTYATNRLTIQAIFRPVP